MNINIKKIAIAILIIIGIFALSHLRKYLNVSTKNYLRNAGTFATPVDEDNYLLQEFKKLFNNRKVILACEEDINDDDRKDLVVINRTDSSSKRESVYKIYKCR